MVKAPTLNVRFETPLHPGQIEVKDHPARFKVLACGRRWGKTKLGGLITVQRALEGGAVWYVTPDFKRARRGWREIKELAIQIPGTVIRESEQRIEFVSGGWLEVKSAHDANALRGEGLNLVVIDEAAYMRDTTWTAELRPSLADHEGDALLISTFDGENWFYELYERGQSLEHPDWMSWRFPTASNPFIDPREIEEAKATTPKAEFEQEYEANPLIYVGAVFDGEELQRASERGQRIEWTAELETEAGLDWGYSNPTVIEVAQEHQEQGMRWVFEQVWHSVELNQRCREIVEIVKKFWITTIYADAAGADENATLADHLSRVGLTTTIIPVPFGKYKETGITVRRFYLERKREAISPKCPSLLKDSKKYRYQENKDKVLKDEVLKKDDHSVDAATALYASRRGVLVGLKEIA